MLIMDILVHSYRRRTDAYCQVQKSERVGGRSRLFSLLRHSSSGSIQMPKSSIVWPHSNNTIVPSGSDCATLCNNRVVVVVCVCVCVWMWCVHSCLFVCAVFWWHCAWAVLCGHVCVCLCGIVCLYPSSMRLRFPKQGVFSAVDNNVPSHWNAAGQMQPKLDPFLASLPLK